ncbi:MAG: heme o synthase, partial [Nitrospirota bacterium]
MQHIIKQYIPLFKLKICILITFSAIVGLILTSPGKVSLSNAMILIITTILASGSASAFNHYYDRDIDALMDRTKGRPLPTGSIINPKNVLIISVILFLSAIFLSAALLNYVVSIHLALGAIVYGVIYTAWLKRRTWTNIIIGGLAGSFAVLAGGASANPEFCLPPLLLAVVLFFWTPSHFWSFAIAFKDDYRKAGIPMLPVVVGNSKTAWYIFLNTIFLFASSLLLPIYGSLGTLYTIVAIIAGGYFIFRNIQLIINPTKEVAWRNFRDSIIYLKIIFIA